MVWNIIDTIPDQTDSEVADICGLWEVIRIIQKDERSVTYPWIKNRFKFNFLPEMVFLCLKDGHSTHGTWELVVKTYEFQTLHSIVLNKTFEYIIIRISEEEMVLSDRKNDYFLVRRL
jgi:hypothetical protein